MFKQKKEILLILVIVMLVTMACGINVNFPVTEVKTGPTETKEIEVPLLDDPEAVANLSLSFGAGNIELNPGADGVLVSGEATYNVADFEPQVKIDDDKITIEQGNLNVRGIPSFNDQFKNEWDFELGNAVMNLSIKAGAYAGDYELGGLSLKNLEISDGAADVKLNFSEPNQIELMTLSYNTGASNVALKNLGNANASTVTFHGGAGSYKLDFGGELQRDLTVYVESGISSVEIIVPENVPAEITFDGGVSNISIDGEWEQDGKVYSQSGEGYKITMIVKMGAGNLKLGNE